MYIRVSHTNVNIYKVWSVGSELTTRLAYIAVWICASRPARNNGTDLYQENGIWRFMQWRQFAWNANPVF